MATLDLEEAELSLCHKVQHGDRAEFSQAQVIHADVLRHIILGLPLVDEEGAPNTTESVFSALARGSRCPRTGVGISIRGGVVKERLILDSAIGDDGGPICPLEFEGTCFEGGFSASHARFSRLSFRDCCFRDLPAAADGGHPVPTIDLSGAHIGSGVTLCAIRPDRAEDHLWIRAPNVQIDGALDLSSSHLRAPFDDKAHRRFSDPPVAALDLARADVRGDLYFLNGGRSEGPINGRGAHIRGDLWLSGVTINVRQGAGLFLQAATIDGMAMLEGRGDRADGSGTVRLFVCGGDLNLRAAEIGDDLHLDNAAVAGKANFLDLTVKNDLIFAAAVRDAIDLSGCRIGGMLDISQLVVGESFKKLTLRAGSIGRSLTRVPSLSDCELVAARRDFLKCLPGVQLLETLWICRHESDADEWAELAQVGFLTDGRQVIRLDGFASGLSEAIKKFGHAVNDGACAIEFLRLYGTYCHGEGAFPIFTNKGVSQRPPFIRVTTGQPALETLPDAFFEPEEKCCEADPKKEFPAYVVEACVLSNGRLCRRRFRIAPADKAVRVEALSHVRDGSVLERVPLFRGPLLCHPEMEDSERDRAIARRTWVTGLTLDGLFDCSPKELALLERRLAPRILATAELQGIVDLENLGCDMLHDEAGRHWGNGVSLRANQFVYNRNSWEPNPDCSRSNEEPLRERGAGSAARARLASAAEKYRTARGSLWKKIKRGAAEWLPGWLTDMFGWTKGLRLGDHWTPWQIRRHWIYQQFCAGRIRRLPSPARYRINSSEYRPQPFEQAIKVARAEGREDFAIHFEILKKNIEWRLFSRRNWEWFCFLGFFGALAWLLFHIRNLTTPVWIAAALIWVLVASISPICHAVMDWLFGHLRRPVRAIATLVIAFVLGWTGVHIANERGLMVVDVDPVATLVGENGKVMVIGSPRQAGNENLASDVPCGERVSEALYALDVLVPLIDLREENRCEVGVAEGNYHRGGILATIESLVGGPVTFWAVLKALYAIAGWFIVSLSILTFAQITRSRAES